MKSEDLKKSLTYDKIKEIYEEKDYRFFDGVLNINIFGIRCEIDTNKFDDLIGIAYQVQKGKEIVDVLELFKATTDPGVHYLKNPINKDGCAIVVPGQYLKSHVVGNHKGYTALVQHSSLNIIRDNNEDSLLDMDSGPVESAPAGCGINIHRSSPIGSPDKVDKYSAGCQVFMNAADFNYFMKLVIQSTKQYGKTVTYTLFESKDFE